jgi:hypothetical protein
MDITKRVIPQDVDLPGRQTSRTGSTDSFPYLFNLMVIVVVPMSYGVADTADIRKHRIHGVARSGGFHSRDNRLKGDPHHAWSSVQVVLACECLS